MNINSASVKNHQADGQPGGKLTVLIVDDSKVIRLALNKILKQDFTVIQASDGEEALTCLEENSAISAIFSDVSMPNLDGFGLLEAVRTSAENRIAKLPFIIITANDDDPDFATRVKNAGGDDLITKPFKTNEITTCINKHILVESTEVAAEIDQVIEAKEPAAAEIEELIETKVAVSADKSIETAADAVKAVDLDVAAILGLDQGEAPVTDNTVSEPAQDSTAVSGVEFVIDEDFFNDAAQADSVVDNATDAVTTPAKSADEFFADIDESMLMPDIEHEVVNAEADSALSSTDKANVSTDDSLLSVDSIDWSLDEPQVAETADISDELSLEIDFDIDNEAAVNARTEIVDEPEASNVQAIPDKKMELEQARKRAMDIAREQAETEEIEDPLVSAAEKARRATERNQIREELQKLREREVVDKTYQKDLDYSSGKIASLFGRLGRIISGIFGFRKK